MRPLVRLKGAAESNKPKAVARVLLFANARTHDTSGRKNSASLVAAHRCCLARCVNIEHLVLRSNIGQQNAEFGCGGDAPGEMKCMHGTFMTRDGGTWTNQNATCLTKGSETRFLVSACARH